MKKLILVLGLLMMIFLVAGVLAENQTHVLSDQKLLDYAKSDFNKSQMMFKDIILGNYNTFPIRVTFPCSDVCPDATIRIIRYDVNLSECNNVGGEIKTILVPVAIAVMGEDFCFPKIIVENNIYDFVDNLTCIIEPGKAYYPGTEKCCGELKSILHESYYDENCNELEGLAGAPICAPCGNGKCESQYGEDKCNCAEDCKEDCTKNENNQSCCKNGTCIRIFDDGLPSACSDGSLPKFSGCDADCKPIVECNNSCTSNKNCWDKYQNCYYICDNQTCKIIFTESEIRLPDYPNCSQGQQGIDINEPQDVICAPDKKQCADGSYVERAGFDCEFMPCPVEKVGFFERIINWFKNLFS